VQFHPESILTGEAGKQLLANFLSLVGATAT
jgi:anthranilate/para-aminobenzoate synthase component II